MGPRNLQFKQFQGASFASCSQGSTAGIRLPEQGFSECGVVVSPSLRSSCGWPSWGLLQIQVPRPYLRPLDSEFLDGAWGSAFIHLLTAIPVERQWDSLAARELWRRAGPPLPSPPHLVQGGRSARWGPGALGSSTVLEWLELPCLGPSCRGVGFSHPEEENSPQWGTGQMNSSIRTHGASSSTTREDWAGTMFNEEKRSPSLLSGKKLWVQNDPIFGQRKS